MSEYTTCCLCGGKKNFSFEPYHGYCNRKWREEFFGEPRVVGVICNEETTPAEMESAIQKAVKTTPRFSNIVVEC